jgi:hypothetical protein
MSERCLTSRVGGPPVPRSGAGAAVRFVMLHLWFCVGGLHLRSFRLVPGIDANSAKMRGYKATYPAQLRGKRALSSDEIVTEATLRNTAFHIKRDQAALVPLRTRVAITHYLR